MKYPKQQLPDLTNWQHWEPGKYICALEPGETRKYELEMSILSHTERIQNFLKTAG